VLEIKRWVLDVMISVDHPVDPAIPSMIRYIRKFSASPILIILDQLFDYFNIGKLTRINGLGLDGVIVDNDDQTAYID
jgi:tRNA G18 (ribose-2'-O)-methylase SpoU